LWHLCRQEKKPPRIQKSFVASLRQAFLFKVIIIYIYFNFMIKIPQFALQDATKDATNESQKKTFFALLSPRKITFF